MSKNKVTIEEPEECSEGPKWEVGALYELVAPGLYQGQVYLATHSDQLVNLNSGGEWSRNERFSGKSRLFRRLPPGAKVTITVGGGK